MNGHHAGAIDVFADVSCPFAHFSLRRFIDRRHQTGSDRVRLRVRAWPLELANGHPLAADQVTEEIADLRAQVAPDLFTGFDPSAFPTSTIGILGTATLAYEHGAEVGEGFNLAIRDALFERARRLVGRKCSRRSPPGTASASSTRRPLAARSTPTALRASAAASSAPRTFSSTAPRSSAPLSISSATASTSASMSTTANSTASWTGGLLDVIADGQLLTLEADEFDVEAGCGWSVVVTGNAREVVRRPDRSLPAGRSWLRPDAARLVCLAPQERLSSY